MFYNRRLLEEVFLGGRHRHVADRCRKERQQRGEFPSKTKWRETHQQKLVQTKQCCLAADCRGQSLSYKLLQLFIIENANVFFVFVLTLCYMT